MPNIFCHKVSANLGKHFSFYIQRNPILVKRLLAWLCALGNNRSRTENRSTSPSDGKLKCNVFKLIIFPVAL